MEKLKGNRIYQYGGLSISKYEELTKEVDTIVLVLEVLRLRIKSKVNLN